MRYLKKPALPFKFVTLASAVLLAISMVELLGPTSETANGRSIISLVVKRVPLLDLLIPSMFTTERDSETLKTLVADLLRTTLELYDELNAKQLEWFEFWDLSFFFETNLAVGVAFELLVALELCFAFSPVPSLEALLGHPWLHSECLQEFSQEQEETFELIREMLELMELPLCFLLFG